MFLSAQIEYHSFGCESAIYNYFPLKKINLFWKSLRRISVEVLVAVYATFSHRKSFGSSLSVLLNAALRFVSWVGI